MPTKEIVADSLGTLDFEGVANLNCQINALSKMSRLSRQKANRNPPAPTSLENLAIPPSYMTNNQGCYFHFKQALWRKLQAFDLVPEYKVLSSPVRKWFKTIGALPFMEPGSVVDVWTNDIVGNLPQEMNEFASYFERTWIGTPTAEPIFDKYLWNMYDTVLARLLRSNNICLI